MSNCVLSGVLSAPFLTGAQEGDEDAEHFSADGDDRHFGCFALGDEALAEGHQGRVAAGGGQGGHVEDPADFGAAAPDGSLAGALSAVVVEGGDADEGGEFASV